MLWQIKIPGACFGVISEFGVVVQAAPIGKWMVGKSATSVAEWVVRKRGTMEPVSPH
jgi:hypothetical protein